MATGATAQAAQVDAALVPVWFPYWALLHHPEGIRKDLGPERF